MTPPAAKGEKLFLLAAALLAAAAALLAPASADASRYLPQALEPVTAPQASLEDLAAGDVDQHPALPTLTAADRLDLVDLAAGTRLEAQRLSLHLASGELGEARKTASGGQTWLAEDNVRPISEMGVKTRRLIFQGLWTDPVTGLSYARARWYDARNATWLSEDPLLDVDSPNLYAFVGWGPHVGTDPMGLCLGLNDMPCSEMAEGIVREMDQRIQAQPIGGPGFKAAQMVGGRVAAAPVTAALNLGASAGNLYSRFKNMLGGHYPRIRDERALEREINETGFELLGAAGDVAVTLPALRQLAVGGKALAGELTAARTAARDAHAIAPLLARPATTQSMGGEFLDDFRAVEQPLASAPDVPRQAMATGKEWYDYLAAQYGVENVEWVSGSGRTITWPSQLPFPAATEMIHVPPLPRSGSFARELASVAGPRPSGAIAHHVQPLGLGGTDSGLANAAWLEEVLHQAGHGALNPLVNQLPYGTVIVVRP